MYSVPNERTNARSTHFARLMGWVIGIVIATGASGQIVRYVNPSLTTGANDGTSWANAFHDLNSGQATFVSGLQLALENADAIHLSEPLTVVEIRLAGGSYSPSYPTADDPNAAFVIDGPIHIYGGYAGSGTSPDTRDTSSNISLVVPYQQCPTCTLRHRWLVVSSGSTGVIVDGLSITRGTDTSAGVQLNASDAEFVDCKFTDLGNLLLCYDCVSITGGAPKFINCEFRRNAACFGGAIVADASAFECTDCVFVNNTTLGAGGAIYAPGTQAIVRRCLFEGNSAGNVGAAYGGLEYDQCIFRHNEGDNRGALRSASLVKRCFFDGNIAYFSGTHAVYDVLDVVDCVFVNHGVVFGTATYVASAQRIVNSVFIDNGSIETMRSSLANVAVANELHNCAVIGNYCKYSGSIAVGIVDNCVVWGNRVNPVTSGIEYTIEQMQIEDGPQIVSHSIIEGLNVYSGNGNTSWPTNSSITFFDRDGPDNVPNTGDDRFDLFGAALVDSGDTSVFPFDLTTVDPTGNTRAVDVPTIVDTGVPLAGQAGVIDIGPTEQGAPYPVFWVGTSGGSNDPAKWNGGIPTAANSAVFMTDAASQVPVTIQGDMSVDGVRFQRGSWLLLPGLNNFGIEAAASGVTVGPDAGDPCFVVVQGVTFESPRILIDGGGRLEAGDTFTRACVLRGRVENLGELSLPGIQRPGLPINFDFGRLAIDGDYDQNVTQGGRRQPGSIRVSVGYDQGAFSGDSIEITGHATLAGKLDVSLLGELPTFNGTQSIRILHAVGGITGRFEGAQIPYVPDGPGGGQLLAVRYQNELDGSGSVYIDITDIATLLRLRGGDNATLQSAEVASANALVVGDYDGQFGDDVAVAATTGGSSPGVVFVFFSRETDGILDWPGFDTTVFQINVGTDPVDIDKGNFDDSNFDDLVVANKGSGDLSILLSRPTANRGFDSIGEEILVPLDGSGVAQRPALTVSVADFAHPVGATDREDIVVCGGAISTSTPSDQRPNQMFLLRNTNATQVAFTLTGTPVALEDEPSSTDPTDVDGDKDYEVAVALNARNRVDVFHNVNSGPGGFAAQPMASAIVGEQPIQVVGVVRRTSGIGWRGRTLDSLLNVNAQSGPDGDQLPDLVTVNAGSSNGTGVGSFSIILSRDTSLGTVLDAGIQFTVDPENTASLTPKQITLIDLDRDSDPDVGLIATTITGDPQVYRMRNDQDTFGLAFQNAVQVNPESSTIPLLISSGDVNLDTSGDLIIVGPGTGSLLPSDRMYTRRSYLTSACRADLDDGTGTGTPDGGVTIDDLLYFLTAFNAGSPFADIDDGTGTGTSDGGITIDDLLYYLTRFNLGC